MNAATLVPSCHDAEPPARTTVFPLPRTSQATPRRGAKSPNRRCTFDESGSARANLLNRRSCRRVDIGIESCQGSCCRSVGGAVVLVAQTQVQGDSGRDAPIVLNEPSEPVSPVVLCIRLRITQENRPAVRDALEEIFQGRENDRALGPAE